MTYRLHSYNRPWRHVPGAVPKNALANAVGYSAAASHNGCEVHPSYSPDTPFCFVSDACSDYGDEAGAQQSHALTESGTAVHHWVEHNSEQFCEQILNLWEIQWYGSTATALHRVASEASTFDSERFDTRHHSPSPPPSQPGSPDAWMNTAHSSSSSISYPQPTGPSHPGPQPACDASSHTPNPSTTPAAQTHYPKPSAFRPAHHILASSTFSQQPSAELDDKPLSTTVSADTGTWKNRQFIMPASTSSRPSPPCGSTPSPEPTAAWDVATSKRAHTTSHHDNDDEEEAAVAAAWRWRFCRRWKAEQVRGMDPAQASDGSDTMAEALLYLNAAGYNNMDLTRTASTELSDPEPRHSASTCGTVGLLGMECFQDSYSAGKLPVLGAAEAQVHASKQVASVAKHAQRLLQQQQDLERKAEAREKGQLDASCAWVGDALEEVEIDDWGKFRFVLLRVKDKGGRHKLLIRGRNYSQEDMLVKQLRQQVAELANQKRVQRAEVELQGSGVMEWRRDRDRHLHLSCTTVYPCQGISLSPKDLSRVAGVLTKKHLPMHYKVAADGNYVS